MSLLILTVVIFYLPQGLLEKTDAICLNKEYRIVCNDSKLINIRNVFFGRHSSIICLDELFRENCNASIWGQQTVVERCQNRSSCQINFYNNILPKGDCKADNEPFAEIVYYCKDNTSLSDIWMDSISEDDKLTTQVVLYSVCGSVLFIITIIITMAVFRKRINDRRSKSKLQDNQRISVNETDNNVESQYDEISINEELQGHDEYHHIKFKRSIKTNDTSYSSSYNQITRTNTSTNHLAYDASPAFNESIYQNGVVKTL